MNCQSYADNCHKTDREVATEVWYFQLVLQLRSEVEVGQLRLFLDLDLLLLVCSFTFDRGKWATLCKNSHNS